jgi:capsular polysaccharide biosynthesis protein
MNINYLNILENVEEIDEFISSIKNIKYLYLKKDENNREIYIYKLNNCFCTGISLSYPNLLLYSYNQLFLPIKEKTMSLNKGTIYESNNMIYKYKSEHIINIVNEPVFFFNYNSDNYYHFLYDSLPNLYTYLFLKKNIPSLKILIYYPNKKQIFCKFVFEFLELLEIYRKDIIIIDNYSMYKNIYISTSYTHDIDSNLPPRKEIYDLFKILIPKALLLTNIKQFPEYIYISRRTWIHNDLSNIGTDYTTRRKIMNEDKLMTFLETKKYNEIFSENLSTIDKIALFYNAKNIIGAIGGGISNVVFSKQDCKLIALISPYFIDINSRFKYCLNIINTVYFTDCYHYDQTEYKKYMRIKIKNTDIIGEIIEVNKKYLKINATKGTNVGWNNSINYDIINIDINKVEKLDNGLNSPYIINIDKLEEILNN